MNFIAGFSSPKKYNVKYVDMFLMKYRIHDKNITLNLSGKIDYRYENKIISNLIAFNDIKIFFPAFDWQNDKINSLSEAYYSIGLKYFNYGDSWNSMFYLSNSLKLNPDINRLKYIIESFINMDLINEIKFFIYFVKSLFSEEAELEGIIEMLENYNYGK